MHFGIGVHHLELGSGVGAFMMKRYPRHVQIRFLVFLIRFYCIFSLVCCTEILCMLVTPPEMLSYVECWSTK